MKSSIKGTFSNIVLFLSFIIVISGVAVLFMIEQGNSFKKVDILNEQKQIIANLQLISKKDVEIALIQFNGKSTDLLYQTQKLHALHEYDLVGTYILNTSDEYYSDLNTLKELINSYNASAYLYFKADMKTEKNSKKVFINSYKNINNHISNIIFTNITYDKAKLEFMHKLSIGMLAILFLFTILFYKRLNKVYSDIAFLQSPSASIDNYNIYSAEADAIFLKMNKKPIKKQSVSNIDPVTGINNNKGLLSSYADKKHLKENNFTAVAIIEIDNFSKKNITVPGEFTQEFTRIILKKIASTISMYEQATDVIARSDYNEFTVILSRKSKEKAYKEIDQIRQSIAELKFVSTTKTPVTITVSGGFYIKPNNESLSNAILETKSILDFAKHNSGNKISQKKDMTGVKI